MKEGVFDRESLKQLREDQRECLEAVRNEDWERFRDTYIDATLGLFQFKAIHTMMVLRVYSKALLLHILPIVFEKVVRKALEFRGEGIEREIPERELH